MKITKSLFIKKYKMAIIPETKSLLSRVSEPSWLGGLQNAGTFIYVHQGGAIW